MAQKRTPIATLKGPTGRMGPRGLPGVNALENDEAVATYATAPGAATYDAVEARLRMVPSYVATVADHPGEFNQDLCLYRGSSFDMMNALLYTALARSSYTPAHIVFVGDSKTAGNGGSGFSLAVPALVRDLLGAGDGVAYAAHALAPQSDNRWAVSGMSYQPTDLYLRSTSTGTCTVSFTSDRRCEGFRLIWFRSGSSSENASIDGGAAVGLGTGDGVIYPNGATTGYYYKDFTGLSSANHTITVTATVGSGGAFMPLGVEHLYSTPRLTVTNAGLSGTSVDDWVPSADRLALFAQLDAVRQGGRRIAIVQLGTNTTPLMDTNYPLVIQGLSDLGFKVILVTPGGSAATVARTSSKRATYDLADSKGLPLVDFTALIGATGSTGMSAQYMTDNLHENQRGYNYEAATIARVLAS